MKLSYPIPLRFLSPAVFLSGATALLYEIVWTRHLSLVLGSTTGAAAAVLSAFMLGLALGALAVGRAADQYRHPRRWYGLLEIGIGAYALVFPTLLGAVGHAFVPACLLVAIPAALMGATLPVLSRAAADTTERGTRAFGSLYAINTLGAVAGALLTTFVLLKSMGLSGSTQLAAFCNIGLGVLFWVLDRLAGTRELFPETPATRWTGDAEKSVVGAFFLAGFAGLALQIVWTRTLVYFLEGFTIAFGLMLATYLLGLGLGALGGTWLALRSPNPRRLLGRVLLLEGVLALGTFLLVGSVGDRVEAMRANYTTAAGIDAGYAFGLFWAAFAVIVPPTLCAGALMPIVARIALSDRESVGQQTGAVYAASTLGAVVAAPVAGFWIVPALGVPGTIVLLAGLVLLAGTWLALRLGVKEWVPAGAAAALFVALFLSADTGTPLVLKSHVFASSKAPRRLVAFEEGLLGGVSVVEEYTDGARRLYIDGFSAAETGRHYDYMRMLGHLPVLLHPDPKDVCVIAFGTGTTAGAVAAHDEVERLVCVEIEPRVYDVAPAFSAANRDVLRSPKTEAVVADGREYVGRGERAFDVITLEPLMPYTPAAVYLYTKEFYEDARKSLKRNGLVCQWIPPQGVSNADLKRLVASVTAVFRHVSLWYFPHAVLVVGGDYAPRVTQEQFFKRCASKAVFADILDVVGGVEHLLGAHVCSGEALREALSGVEPMVDDRTDLEFRPLPRRFGKRSMTYHAENLEFLAEHHQQQVEWLRAKSPAIEAGRALARRSMGAALSTLAVEMRRRVDGGAVVPASVLRDVVERDPLAVFAQRVYQRRRYTELFERQQYADAVALRYAPDRSLAFLALAEQADEAQAGYYRLLALRENALLDPALLDRMAQGFKGPQRRFLENRARVQRGESADEGPEARPEPPAPDLKTALAEQDVEAARAALAMARGAGVEEALQRQARAWARGFADKRRAALFLFEIGLIDKAAEAARRLQGVEDKVALATIFAAHYPRSTTWKDMCADPSPRLREAAADAAASLAYAEQAPMFLPVLAPLLDPDREKEERVRLSVYLAFRAIRPEAESIRYDHRNPDRAAIARLVGLATNKAAAAGGD